MKIAISATESNMDADVDPRFGRCAYFVILDLETEGLEMVNNANAQARGGAGISTAQMIVSKNIEAVITGNCGPNAYQVLEAANVKVLTGASGKVRDAVQKYRNGEYAEAKTANVADHFGSGGGRGVGMGKNA